MAKTTATKTKASSAQPEQENVVVESTSVPTEKKVKKVRSKGKKTANRKPNGIGLS